MVLGVCPAVAARRDEPIRTAKSIDDDVLVERGYAIVRLDPKPGAPAHACDDLAAADLQALVGRRPMRVSSVERVPRPERHWLVIDNSESAEGRRGEAKRSALEYVRTVMTPGIDSAAVVEIDEDAILVSGPSSDPDELARDIEKVPPGGASALLDGLEVVLRQIEGDRHEHLVLFWTDGLDNESVSQDDDVFRTMARVPQATIFPLALLPPGSNETQPRLVMLRAGSTGKSPVLGDLLFEAAARTGGEVFASSDANWLERVRGWIGRRFAVTFDPSESSAAPRRAGHRLAFLTPGKPCTATVLPDPFARPDAIAGESPPAPRAWVRLHKRQKGFGDDPVCNPALGGAGWDTPLDDLGDAVAGCVLDMVASSGPVARRGAPVELGISRGAFEARRIRIATPPLQALPGRLADGLDVLVPGTDEDPSSSTPYTMEGSALLTQRARIAASLFAFRPAYHDFALARLARIAQDDLAAIERGFAKTFPELPPSEIENIARASRPGQRSLAASQTPTDADLADVLAAWLGDVRARDLFSQWEAQLCDERIRHGADGSAFTRWAGLRERLGYPVSARIVAPLVLLHDRQRDVLGFVRVVLPRPEVFLAAQNLPSRAIVPNDDRIAPVPLGLWLLDRVAASPEIGKLLASRGYGVASLRSDPAALPPSDAPGVPLRRDHVVLELTGEPRRKVTLEADIETFEGGALSLKRLEPAVLGDDDLAALLEPLRVVPPAGDVNARATPRPSSRPN
jgi:von Willebrand factor type A domain